MSQTKGKIDLIDGLQDALDDKADASSVPTDLTDLGITDGSVDQVLSTDGAGNFSFVDQTGGGGGSASVNVDTFTGDGSTTVFTLSVTPASKNLTNVHVGRAYQEKSSYSLSGNQITISPAPANGVSIEVETLSSADIGVPSDDTVSTAKIQDGAVIIAKLASSARPRVQTKTRVSNVTGGGAVSEYSFNNVQPGWYRLTVNIRIETRGSDDAHVEFTDPDNNIIIGNLGQLNSFLDQDFKAANASATKVFKVLTAGTVECNFVRNGTTGQIFHTNSYVQLEALPHYQENETTEWD